jgi:hypothetical protein
MPTSRENRQRIEECLNKESHVWDDVTKTCVKNIDTVEIFLKKPLVGSLAVALLAYVFAAFLYKIKGMPLAKSNSLDKTYGKYIKCTSIDIGKVLFTKDITQGVVQEEAYKQDKKNKYGKIFWPWLSEYYYPVKPNKTASGKLEFFYVLMAPLFFSLKWATGYYYSIFSNIKKIFYKANHWGSLSEISKINKSLWMNDFFVCFVCIPALLMFVLPIIVVMIIMSAMVIAPLRAMVWNATNSDSIRSSNTDGEKKIRNSIFKGLKIFGWVILYGLMGFINTFIISILHILWFGSVMMGTQEEEADGRKTIMKTWANIIWDYKFIWAILAGTIWLTNFKMYLAGDSKKNVKMFDFITPENQEMMLGIVGGALVILLIIQQNKYYKGLSNDKPTPRNCGAGCGPPPSSEDDNVSGKSGKCPNPYYDPKNKKWRNNLSSISKKIPSTKLGRGISSKFKNRPTKNIRFFSTGHVNKQKAEAAKFEKSRRTLATATSTSPTTSTTSTSPTTSTTSTKNS